MTIPNQPGGPASSQPWHRSKIPPVILMGLSILGLLACWKLSILGVDFGAPLTGLLQSILGEESVRPARNLLERILTLSALSSAIWLILGRLAPRAYDPKMEAAVLDLKAATTTLLVFMACAVATIGFLARNLFGGPGTWLGDNFGPPALGLTGTLLLAGFTVLLGFALRWLHRRIRTHPLYGSDVQRRPR
ncbi:MAG: hypothetical protein ABI609_00625 [Acidobacteriota bacterium]